MLLELDDDLDMIFVGSGVHCHCTINLYQDFCKMVKAAAEIRSTELSESSVDLGGAISRLDCTLWAQAREAFLQYVFQVWERRKKNVLDVKG